MSGVIDLTSDNSDVEENYKRPSKRPKVELCPIVQTVDDDDSDCEIEEIEQAAPQVFNTEDGNDEDADISVTGEAGENIARDYPHLRSRCLLHKFDHSCGESNVQKCDNCYCFVCDKEAKACTSWGDGTRKQVDHCHASPDVQMWKIMRARTLGQEHLQPAGASAMMRPAPSRGVIMPGALAAARMGHWGGPILGVGRPNQGTVKELAEPCADLNLFEIGVLHLPYALRGLNTTPDLKAKLYSTGIEYRGPFSTARMEIQNADPHRLTLDQLVGRSHMLAGPAANSYLKFTAQRPQIPPNITIPVTVVEVDGSARPITYGVEIPRKNCLISIIYAAAAKLLAEKTRALDPRKESLMLVKSCFDKEPVFYNQPDHVMKAKELLSWSCFSQASRGTSALLVYRLPVTCQDASKPWARRDAMKSFMMLHHCVPKEAQPAWALQEGTTVHENFGVPLLLPHPKVGLFKGKKSYTELLETLFMAFRLAKRGAASSSSSAVASLRACIKLRWLPVLQSMWGPTRKGPAFGDPLPSALNGGEYYRATDNRPCMIGVEWQTRSCAEYDLAALSKPVAQPCAWAAQAPSLCSGLGPEGGCDVVGTSCGDSVNLLAVMRRMLESEKTAPTVARIAGSLSQERAPLFEADAAFLDRGRPLGAVWEPPGSRRRPIRGGELGGGIAVQFGVPLGQAGHCEKPLLRYKLDMEETTPGHGMLKVRLYASKVRRRDAMACLKCGCTPPRCAVGTPWHA
ncbi:hypothetical protein CYMTET_43078 [Cymbomonas tetramitiformis]|uniref:Uncharacterized protein n=1 Tax=Cymbomonas tetramitiformis TaxID=36881 RepID=A0AAE0C4S5_9CHLO|nr:hypothetical protein CYMTET_43078 [Cymbomonas tetramitiformis]